MGLLAIAFATYVAKRPMDFRVYHYGARGVFTGTRPVYGTSSGLGWPMHYRYPPVFLLLFAPFAALPLGPAAGLWVFLKLVVLVLLLRLISRRFRPVPAMGRLGNWVVPALLAGPFILEEFRYGNVQFFIVALAITGLLLLDDRP